MPRKIPKTGLAATMRTWMSLLTRAFTLAEVCLAIGLTDARDRAKAGEAMRDFLRRGEIVRLANRKYQYNHHHKPRGYSEIKTRILKAMHVSGTFSAAEVRRLSGAPTANFVHKIIRELLREGRLTAVARRKAAQGGRERVYHVVDRVKFRRDLLP